MILRLLERSVNLFWFLERFCSPRVKLIQKEDFQWQKTKKKTNSNFIDWRNMAPIKSFLNLSNWRALTMSFYCNWLGSRQKKTRYTFTSLLTFTLNWHALVNITNDINFNNFLIGLKNNILSSFLSFFLCLGTFETHQEKIIIILLSIRTYWTKVLGKMKFFHAKTPFHAKKRLYPITSKLRKKISKTNNEKLLLKHIKIDTNC